MVGPCSVGTPPNASPLLADGTSVADSREAPIGDGKTARRRASAESDATTSPRLGRDGTIEFFTPSSERNGRSGVTGFAPEISEMSGSVRQRSGVPTIQPVQSSVMGVGPSRWVWLLL